MYTPPLSTGVNFGLEIGYTAPLAGSVSFALVAYSSGATPSPLPGIISPCGLGYAAAKNYQIDRSAALRYIVPQQKDRRARASWVEHAEQDAMIATPWGSMVKADAKTSANWVLGSRTDNGGTTSVWRLIPARDNGSLAAWGHGVPQDQGAAELWRHLATAQRRDQARDLGQLLPFRSSDIFRLRGGNDMVPYVISAPGDPVNFDLTLSGYTPPAAGDPVDFSLSIYETVMHDLPISPKDSGNGTPYRQLAISARQDQALDQDIRIQWGPGGPGWYRDSPPVSTPWPSEQDPVVGPEPPLILEAYKLMASIDVVRLPDRTPVLVNEISIRTDVSAFCWQFSFSPARKEDLALVAPTGSLPTEVEITINGYTWTGVCEEYSVDKRHGSSGYSVSGRSTTVLLAAPYAVASTYSQSLARNASQLIDDELTNTGYTSTYNGIDWLIPGDVWNYSGLTPMGAIQRIAEASGARVVSEMATKAVRIEKRHPNNPWDWSSAVADVALNESIITTWGGRWNPSPEYNACYVVGGEQGVIVQATRTGTAGDKQAPQIVEALCTAVECGRERGRTALCESGNWESITATLPLLSGTGLPGLIHPGKLVEATQGGETFKALCGSVQITGSRSSSTSIKQQITLERYRGS